MPGHAHMPQQQPMAQSTLSHSLRNVATNAWALQPHLYPCLPPPSTRTCLLWHLSLLPWCLSRGTQFVPHLAHRPQYLTPEHTPAPAVLVPRGILPCSPLDRTMHVQVPQPHLRPHHPQPTLHGTLYPLLTPLECTCRLHIKHRILYTGPMAISTSPSIILDRILT